MRYKGDKIHVNELAIPGAKIEQLHLAFKSEYTNFVKPIDVLLAAGLNNFKSDTPDEIMKKIRAFKETVVRHSDGSTFAICTLPFAPHLVDMEPKPNSQSWNLGEKTMRMFRLNEMIKAENRVPAQFSKVVNPRLCQNAPKFHTWGLMSDPKATREHERRGNWFDRICGYRLGDWREYELEKKLHFKDSVRLRAGKCTVRYFMSLYKLTDQSQTVEEVSSSINALSSSTSETDTTSQSESGSSSSSRASTPRSGKSTSSSSTNDSSVICLTSAAADNDDSDSSFSSWSDVFSLWSSDEE